MQIYGAYQLHVYGTDMHFYVMQNIFKGKSVVSGIRMTLAEGRGSVSSGTGEVINEKYDIKGSWVDRNAKVPSEGQLVTCSNCNQKYEFVRPESAIRRLNRLGLRYHSFFIILK
jgi:1-phosphatidylinositol-4-phosphate 5-kinase